MIDLTQIKYNLIPTFEEFDNSIEDINLNYTFNIGKRLSTSKEWNNANSNMLSIDTNDIYNILKNKYDNNDIRVISGSNCLEVQNCHFLADKDYIVREPNYEYAKRELAWYKSQSLYVDDIPGFTPKIWKEVSSTCNDIGKINSNYGWCIFSNENGNQYRKCLDALIKDNSTRQAVMFYNRPSMHVDSVKDGMHDFMCTYQVQCFLNECFYLGDAKRERFFILRYIVYQRSQDLVFGYDNDILWHNYVAYKLCKDFTAKTGYKAYPSYIECNVGSAHIYERHFKFLNK